MKSINFFSGIIILGVFTFNFLHSEMGFLSHEVETNYCVDFCKIVDGSGNPVNSRASVNICKCEITFFITDDLITRDDKKEIFFSQDNSLKYCQKTNKVYLHNNTFLI